MVSLKNYDYDGMLKHLNSIESLLIVDDHQAMLMSYNYFFDKVFDEGSEAKKIMSNDLISRRLKKFNVNLPITDFDKELLLITVRGLKKQVEEYKPISSEIGQEE
jgi:hypothetical protein